MKTVGFLKAEGRPLFNPQFLRLYSPHSEGLFCLLSGYVFTRVVAGSINNSLPVDIYLFYKSLSINNSLYEVSSIDKNA